MKLAFIDFLEKEDKILGGILVTDLNTKPIEFRTTTDIEIDELQKILYGDSLKNVLFKEKLTVDLVKSTKEDFNILLTKEKDFLNLRQELNVPIGYLHKYDPFKAFDKFSHKIVNITDRFEPLVLTISKEDEKNLVSFSKTLQDIYKVFNLLEPFNRIKKALDYISST